MDIYPAYKELDSLGQEQHTFVKLLKLKKERIKEKAHQQKHEKINKQQNLTISLKYL